MKRKGLAALLIAICLIFAGCGGIKPGSILEDLQTAAYTEKSANKNAGEETGSAGEETGGGSAYKAVYSEGWESAPGSDTASRTKRTLLIYMAGTDLESESGAASADIVEMAESGFFSDTMNVVICTGGSSYWWNSEIPADTCSVFSIIDKGISLCGTLKNSNMGENATLTEFLDFGYANFPADEYGLIFWDHGGGSLLGCCFDENHDNDSLSVSEMDLAFQNAALCRDGIKFEWIGFDACLMAMIEVADVFVPYAKYMIASQENESGSGWDYGCLRILSSSACADGSEVADCIGEYYENACNSRLIKPLYTISCLDLSKLDDVKKSLDSLADVMVGMLKEGAYANIARARSAVRTFGKSGGSGLYDSVDIYNLAELLNESGIKGAAELLESVGRLVKINRTNVSDSYGVSLYFPFTNKERISEWLTDYAGFGFSDSYCGFINDFCEILTGSSISEWKISEIVPDAEEMVSEGTEKISACLSAEDAAAYAKGCFSVWEDTGTDGDYIMWYKSGDVTMDENGVLTAEYDGRQYILCFGDVELPCSVIMSEKNGDYESYYTPIFLYDMDDPYWFAHPIRYYVYFYVDNEHPDGVITGIRKMLNESSLIPSREDPTIEKGDLVQTFLFSRQIRFYDNGKPMPFENWGNDYFDLNEEYVGDVTEMSIKRVSLPEDGDYYCLFQIYDTQNESHETNLVKF